MIKGWKGVKQGGQHHMLLELFLDAKARRKPVSIGAIVNDIAIQGQVSHVACPPMAERPRAGMGLLPQRKSREVHDSPEVSVLTKGLHR